MNSALLLLTIILTITVGLISKTSSRRHHSKHTTNLHNWAATFNYGTQNIQYPRSIAQVQKIVKSARRLRCMGTRHSFSLVGDSKDTILGTVGLKNIARPSFNGPAIDPTVPSVWVQAGITYTDLAPFLQDNGYALANLAGLAELSIAGATQTGAHGSGNSLGCLGTQIRAMQLVMANGSVALIPPGDHRLKALSVGLGAFGVITALELNIEPTFNVTTHIFLGLPQEELLAHFDAIMSCAYSVEFFSNFQTPFLWNRVWVIDRSDSNSNIGSQETLLNTSAVRATAGYYASQSGYLSKQGIEQPWHYGLVTLHLGLSGFAEVRYSNSGNTSGADEIQAEYFLPYENATAAIRAISVYWDVIAKCVLVTGIRTIAGDDLWMSPSQGTGKMVSIGMTFKPLWELVDPLLLLIEEALIQFGVRPHWGKYFRLRPDQFLHTFPQLDKFRALAEQLDPKHKFRNEFLEKNVFAKHTKLP